MARKEVIVTVRPSLDRIKALDSLPDLAAQLDEARRLCTHSARADMALKWLLEKLKQSGDTRTEPSTWDLLAHILRILQPERLAPLLSTADLLQIVQDALHDGSAGVKLLHAVSPCLSLLLELSSTTHGAALRALVSADAAKAASFVGTWLQAIQQAAIGVGSELNGLLQPATQIWHLRKQRDDDNEVFTKYCLVPAAALLARASGELSTTSVKRKRQDADEVATIDSKRTLETLLAKHVFLPARLAMLGAHEHQEVSNAALDMSQHVDQRDSTALPALLDVALRCAPVANQRQRMKERPWVESIFAALLGCIVKRHVLTDHATLVAMLVVIGKRASLSKSTMLGLAKANVLGDNCGGEKDWKLVAQIIALDANVFTDRETAERLFRYINATNEALHPHRETDSQSDDLELTNLIAQAVLLPLMHAFAKSRSLLVFIDLWSRQLGDSVQNWSIWLQPVKALSGLVETSLTLDQSTELIRTFCKRFHVAGTDGVAAAGHGEIRANTIVLQSVLAGVSTSELLDNIHADLEVLLGDLLNQFDRYNKNTGGERFYVWRLLSTALGLWVPLWVARQKDKKAIVARVASIFDSEAVRYANGILMGANSSFEGYDDESSDVQAFSSILAQLLHQYSPLAFDFNQRATDNVNLDIQRLSASMQATGVTVDHDMANLHAELVKGYAEDISTSACKGEGIITRLHGLRALVAVTTRQPKIPSIEATVAESLTCLDCEDPNPEWVSAAIQMLITLPPAVMTSSQRGRVLDAVSTVSLLASDTHRMRLLLMTNLLEEPCPETVKILDDFTTLWQLAGWIQGKEQATQDTPGEELQTLELLERLTSRVVGKLLVHQRNEAAAARLSSLATAVEAECEVAVEERGFVQQLQHLSVTKVFLKDSAANTRPQALPTLIQSGLLGLYADLLVKDIETLVGRVEAQSECRLELAAVLSALTHVPRERGTKDRISPSPDKALFDLYARYVTAISDAERLELDNMVLVRWLEVLCVLGSSELSHQRSLVQFATSLLERRLSPRENAAVVEAFSTACQTFHAETRMQYLQALLPRGGQPSATSLLLSKAVIASMTKDDFAGEASTDRIPPQVFLHRLLDSVAGAKDLVSYRRAYECLIAVLRTKPFMTNQQAIEATLVTLHELVPWQIPWSRIMFLDVCGIATVLLQQHRSRLRDRLHMVIELLKTIMGCFFRKTKIPGQQKPLAPRHARTFTRLLQLLCSPPQLRGKSKTSDLVDEVRKARNQIGQYVRYVVHHFCSQVLQGTLGEGVREALMPGLWAMLEVMEVSDIDAVKSLSAAMNNSERAVLRGLYDEYRSFGKWKGG